VLLLGLDLLSLVLLLAEELLALTLGLELQLDILESSCAQGAQWEGEFAATGVWLVEAFCALSELLRVKPVSAGSDLASDQALSHQQLDVLFIF
jgi:hypothetical protein